MLCLIPAQNSSSRGHISFKNPRQKRLKDVFLSEQVAQRRTQSLLRSAAHGVYMLLEQFDLEARHEPLGQLANTSPSVCQVFPFVGRKEHELSGDVGRSIRVAEMQMRNRRRPRIDVCWEETRYPNEGVDEAAFACLHLADDGNATGELGQRIKRICEEGPAMERRGALQCLAAGHQLAPKCLERGTNPVPYQQRVLVGRRAALKCRGCVWNGRGRAVAPSQIRHGLPLPQCSRTQARPVPLRRASQLLAIGSPP